MSWSDFLQETELSPFRGQGVVKHTVTVLYPGRVYFRATYWPARLVAGVPFEDVPPGARVEVLGRDGLTLLVRPLSREATSL